jgi:hypothetical protein
MAALIMLLSAGSIANAQTPPSTQDPDLRAALVQLRAEARDSHRAYTRIEGTINRCQTPDPDAVLAAQTVANALSQNAAALAAQLPGQQHAEALRLQSVAETDFWYLANPHVPDRCYQPPTE